MKYIRGLTGLQTLAGPGPEPLRIGGPGGRAIPQCRCGAIARFCARESGGLLELSDGGGWHCRSRERPRDWL
jgi:hypothetical protein